MKNRELITKLLQFPMDMEVCHNNGTWSPNNIVRDIKIADSGEFGTKCIMLESQKSIYDEPQFDLLVSDIASRYPYGIIAHYHHEAYKHDTVDFDAKISSIDIQNRKNITVMFENGDWAYVEEIQPYLRPMSSMTTDEAMEMIRIIYPDCAINHLTIEESGIDATIINSYKMSSHITISFEKIYSAAQIDWLNKNMFDYRGLIKLGLAKIKK